MNLFKKVKPLKKLIRIWTPESMLPTTGGQLVPYEYHDHSFKAYVIWLYELADRKVKNYLRSKGWTVD